MVRRSLYALGLLLATAIPASAGTVTVGSVTASQYDYPYFAAMVQATGTTVLGDIQLTVTRNGTTTVVQPDTIDRTNLDGYGLYVIYQVRKYYTPNVVNPGDMLTAVVLDQDAGVGGKSVPCVAHQPKKARSEIDT